MKDLNYYVALGRLSESILGIKSLLSNNDELLPKLRELEDIICKTNCSYKFFDDNNCLERFADNNYSYHEKKYFAKSMQLLAETVHQNIYLLSYRNGTHDDLCRKIDFVIQVEGKSYSLQFKTRSYESKKDYMEDITFSLNDCFQCEADILIESIYDSEDNIKEQHFFNCRRLRELINKTIFVEGRNLLEGWKYKNCFGLKKEGEDPIDNLDIKRYNENRSFYIYADNIPQLKLNHPVYILRIPSNSNMVPLPIPLLKDVSVDLDSKNIFRNFSDES